jgi:hypothetical protein
MDVDVNFQLPCIEALLDHSRMRVPDFSVAVRRPLPRNE